MHLLQPGAPLSRPVPVPPFLPGATWPVIDQLSCQQPEYPVSVRRGRRGVREGHWQVKERGCQDRWSLVFGPQLEGCREKVWSWLWPYQLGALV